MEDCRIIKSLYADDLEENINYLLSRGWKLVNVFTYGGDVCAALVRE